MSGNGVGQRGGDDGLDGDGVLRHGALLDAACADVVQQQSAHLVAGDQLIAAVRTLHGDAHAVGVGVGGQHQVCTGLGGEVEAQLQGIEDLRVGVRAGGKVAVGILLLRHDGDVGDAHIVQDVGDRHQTGAVQGAVDQLQASRLAQARAHLTCLDGSIEGVLAVVAHKADEALLDTLCKGDVLCAGEDIGLLDLIVDDSGGVIGHLAAVGAVGLVAVVLGRVVRSCDHDARVALVVTGGKAQGGDRHQRVVDAHLDAVRCQDPGSRLGKDVALEAAVVADGHGLIAALRLDPVCQTLRGLTHDVDVHTVGASAQHAAQAGGAKLQRNGEAVLDLVVISLDLGQFRLQICVFQICCQPALILILIHIAHLTFVIFDHNGQIHPSLLIL